MMLWEPFMSGNVAFCELGFFNAFQKVQMLLVTKRVQDGVVHHFSSLQGVWLELGHEYSSWAAARCHGPGEDPKQIVTWWQSASSVLGLARTDAPADISITLIGSCMGCTEPHFPPRAAPCVQARCSPAVPPLLLAMCVGRIILRLLSICMVMYKRYSMLYKVVIVSWKRNTRAFCAAVSFGCCLLCLSLFASPSL